MGTWTNKPSITWDVDKRAWCADKGGPPSIARCSWFTSIDDAASWLAQRVPEIDRQITHPEFKRATVRFFGAFSENERRQIARHPDRSGNLVVTIRDTCIEVGFDAQDHVYVVPITPEAAP